MKPICFATGFRPAVNEIMKALGLCERPICGFTLNVMCDFCFTTFRISLATSMWPSPPRSSWL